jgi:hypothetical protein
MRKLPRWVQSRTRLGKDLAQRDIAKIARIVKASRAEAGPRIVLTSDTVQVMPPPWLAFGDMRRGLSRLCSTVANVHAGAGAQETVPDPLGGSFPVPRESAKDRTPLLGLA